MTKLIFLFAAVVYCAQLSLVDGRILNFSKVESKPRLTRLSNLGKIGKLDHFYLGLDSSTPLDGYNIKLKMPTRYQRVRDSYKVWAMDKTTFMWHRTKYHLWRYNLWLGSLLRHLFKYEKSTPEEEKKWEEQRKKMQGANWAEEDHDVDYGN